jgi:SAM-dependent methyltransferase
MQREHASGGFARPDAELENPADGETACRRRDRALELVERRDLSADRREVGIGIEVKLRHGDRRPRICRVDVIEFVSEQLPPAPARVLEVGCGHGELARTLAAEGYEVTAIDPEAPEGFLFRRVTIEDFTDAEPYDAIVASRSLHHVHDLGAGLDKIGGLLRPGGALVVDEFAWDRLDDATSDWYYGQLRARTAAGQLEGIPPSLEACREEWRAEHADLHGFDALRRELGRRFEERYFAWAPYLYRYLGSATAAGLEQALIEAGAIQPLGFRYVGVRGAAG